ncbi:hypothetical protein C2G38_2194554 [Gigaspora rosea]|uniref:Uncharacterized protein n=1 Tax=Gigaspora rosea TaxID=44941 RepID=A0A397UWK3_9GLOM|nr:hypothetical protein C2G38_2194554 [Gigaspora rosea]
MSETKHCEACQTTDSAKFRSLGGEMWKKAINNGLQAKNTNIDEDAENEVARKEEESTKIELSEAIKILAKILYKREYVRHEEPIYSFDEIRQLFQKIQPLLKDFFVQICLAAQLLECTNNKGINMMANLGVTLTAKLVNHNKRRTSNAHEEHVGVALVKHSENAFVLNIDDYHNIHTPYQPDTTTTSFHQESRVAKKCSEDELIDRLMNNLKGVVGYMNALQVVHNQEPMQEYLFNNAIPIIADWPSYFYIRKAIAHWYLLNNETIPSKRQHAYEELKKKLDKKEPDVEDVGIIVNNNSDNADNIVDNIPKDY